MSEEMYAKRTALANFIEMINHRAIAFEISKNYDFVGYDFDAILLTPECGGQDMFDALCQHLSLAPHTDEYMHEDKKIKEQYVIYRGLKIFVYDNSRKTGAA